MAHIATNTKIRDAAGEMREVKGELTELECETKGWLLIEWVTRRDGRVVDTQPWNESPR